MGSVPVPLTGQLDVADRFEESNRRGGVVYFPRSFPSFSFVPIPFPLVIRLVVALSYYR